MKLKYIQHKTNIAVETFNLTYARDTSSFKISVPYELFLTICSADFCPAPLVVREFEIKNMEERYSRVPRLSDTRYSAKGTKGK